MNEFLVWVAIVLRVSGFALAMAFSLRYFYLVPSWRDSQEGRHLMGFTTLVACFLGYAICNALAAQLDDSVPNHVVDGDYPGRAVIGVVLYLAVNWYLYRRNRLLTSALREG